MCYVGALLVSISSDHSIQHMVTADAKMQYLLKENCSFSSLLLCVILNNVVIHSARKIYPVEVMGQENWRL